MFVCGADAAEEAVEAAAVEVAVSLIAMAEALRTVGGISVHTSVLVTVKLLCNKFNMNGICWITCKRVLLWKVSNWIENDQTVLVFM